MSKLEFIDITPIFSHIFSFDFSDGYIDDEKVGDSGMFALRFLGLVK